MALLFICSDCARRKSNNETVIARDVVRALHANVCVPADQLQVTVADGRITLDGYVHWEVQNGRL